MLIQKRHFVDSFERAVYSSNRILQWSADYHRQRNGSHLYLFDCSQTWYMHKFFNSIHLRHAFAFWSLSNECTHTQLKIQSLSCWRTWRDAPFSGANSTETPSVYVGVWVCIYKAVWNMSPSRVCPSYLHGSNTIPVVEGCAGNVRWTAVEFGRKCGVKRWFRGGGVEFWWAWRRGVRWRGNF